MDVCVGDEGGRWLRMDLLEQCGHVLSSSEVAYRDELLAALDDAGEDA